MSVKLTNNAISAIRGGDTNLKPLVQLNEKVFNGDIRKGSVVQLIDYMCNTIQNRKEGDTERLINYWKSCFSINRDTKTVKLDKLGPRGRFGFGARSDYQSMDNLDENFNSLSDGMDGKLKKAANYFGFYYDELEKEDYIYRPDVNFRPGTTYETKDLDIRRAGVWKPFQREEFTTRTEDVLKYADFRIQWRALDEINAGVYNGRLLKAKVDKICEAAEKLVNFSYITGTNALFRLVVLVMV
ncbi:hypothetical protein MKW98_014610 [Papaver atlanticum]|uniref:Uncharacterized protein n=1 Tax=Papaver atlanticum TaxID=357466 RepID=A0AAD4XEF9_9MAGN|nr:hypothetical protein MKW98_014610 [Papaver atlanticum]